MCALTVLSISTRPQMHRGQDSFRVVRAHAGDIHDKFITVATEAGEVAVVGEMMQSLSKDTCVNVFGLVCYPIMTVHLLK